MNNCFVEQIISLFTKEVYLDQPNFQSLLQALNNLDDQDLVLAYPIKLLNKREERDAVGWDTLLFAFKCPNDMTSTIMNCNHHEKNIEGLDALADSHCQKTKINASKQSHLITDETRNTDKKLDQNVEVNEHDSSSKMKNGKGKRKKSSITEEVLAGLEILEEPISLEKNNEKEFDAEEKEKEMLVEESQINQEKSLLQENEPDSNFLESNENATVDDLHEGLSDENIKSKTETDENENVLNEEFEEILKTEEEEGCNNDIEGIGKRNNDEHDDLYNEYPAMEQNDEESISFPNDKSFDPYGSGFAMAPDERRRSSLIPCLETIQENGEHINSNLEKIGDIDLNKRGQIEDFDEAIDDSEQEMPINEENEKVAKNHDKGNNIDVSTTDDINSLKILNDLQSMPLLDANGNILVPGTKRTPTSSFPRKSNSSQDEITSTQFFQTQLSSDGFEGDIITRDYQGMSDEINKNHPYHLFTKVVTDIENGQYPDELMDFEKRDPEYFKDKYESEDHETSLLMSSPWRSGSLSSVEDYYHGDPRRSYDSDSDVNMDIFDIIKKMRQKTGRVITKQQRLKMKMKLTSTLTYDY